jgi:hypothetical protein
VESVSEKTLSFIFDLEVLQPRSHVPEDRHINIYCLENSKPCNLISVSAETIYYHSVQNLLSSRLLSKNTKIRIRKTIILPVVLYGCVTWTLTLREEHRLMVFENRVLRSIFRPKRDEVTGGWRKLHNEDLHNLYYSQRIIRMIK